MQTIVAYLTSVALVATETVSLSQTRTSQRPRITGTYGNMYYNSEGGDLIGDELKIVNTKQGYQGVLQISEGAPEPLILVDVKLTGTNISFSIPDSSPYAGSFDGKIENGLLRGEFHFKSGGADKVELKKGKSYWD
jgi:hypothetical protein